MGMQGAECGDLKYPRLFNKHRGRIALLTTDFSVRGSGDGDGRAKILGEAQAANQISVQPGQMASAIRIAECNVGQFWNQIHSPEPFFNRRVEFTLQDGRHARYLLFFHQMSSSGHASLSRYAHALSAGSHEAIQKTGQNRPIGINARINNGFLVTKPPGLSPSLRGETFSCSFGRGTTRPAGLSLP